jgi:drug/metabolite transporter (DMT)-like permease
VKRSNALKLVVMSLLSGGQFVAARIAGEEAPPFTASFLRYVFASIALLGVHLIVERRFSRLTFRQWVWLTLLGLSGVFLFNLFFFSAISISPTGRSSVASIILFKERFSILRILGLMVALLGVSWVISGGEPARLLRGEIGRGDLYIFGAMLSLAYLGLMGSVVAFILYYQGIRSIGPSRTAIFINLVPVWAVVLGTLFLGERITLPLVIGAVAVIGGVFLTARSKHRS